MRNRRFHRQSGMSLVELLIVAGLMGFVAVTASSLLFPFFHMTKQVRQNLSDMVDNDLTQRVLSGELKRAFVMRADGLSCGDPVDTLFKTSNGASGATTVDVTRGFSLSFFTAPYSSVASRDLNALGTLFVTDPQLYPKDSLVLAMDAADSSTYGFFRVRASDPTARSIVVDPDSLTGNPTGCSNRGSAKTLSELFTASGGSTLMLHRIRIVTYRRDQDNDRRLYKTVWPEEGDRPVGSLAMDRLRSMSVKGYWQTYAETQKEGSVDRSGKWTAEVKYEVEVPSLVRRSEKPAELPTRKLTSLVNFELAATKRVNRQARTTASDTAVTNIKYPTCSVMMSSSPVSVGIDFPPTNLLASKFQNTKTYLLEGAVSEDVAASIDVALQSSTDGFVSCYRMADALKTQPITTMGMVGTIHLNREGAGFEKLVCFAKGTIDATASMQYFDPSLGRFLGVACTGSAISAPTGYWHAPNNKRAECWQNGEISFGDRLMSRATSEPGPTLFVGNQSCIWANRATGAQGSWSDCDWTKHVTENLVKVQILPTGLEISGYPANNIIDCIN